MSSSNDGNNALVVYNSSALPTEQNYNTSFLKELQAKINLCELIFRGSYNDQECNNLFHELIDFLIRNNQMLLAESIVNLLLSNKLTVDYKRHILKEMIYFVKDGQMNALCDFCSKNIPLSINLRKVLEAQAMSQIRMNEAEYYSHLRIDEERERFQMRLNEEEARSQNRINEYRQMRLSCFEPIIVGDVLNEDIHALWERYKQIRTSLKNAPEKIKTMGRNYVDEEISYVEIL